MRTLTRSVILTALLLALISAPVANAAVVTLPFAEFGGGAVAITFDYNEGNGNILRFRCNNFSTYDAWFGVYLVDPDTGEETLLGERICTAGSVIEQNVPGVSMTWDLQNGGINMGNYVFRARWPAE